MSKNNYQVKSEVIENKEAKSSIADFDQIVAQFWKRKLDANFVSKLKSKLLKDFKKNTLVKEEYDFMRKMFSVLHGGAQFIGGKVNLTDEESALNALWESEEIPDTDIATVKSDHAPAVNYLKRDLECKFKHNPETNRYLVYVPRHIPIEWQMPDRLAKLEAKGHMVSTDEPDYPKPKTIMHRLSLKPFEFDLYFEVEKDVLKQTAAVKTAFEL